MMDEFFDVEDVNFRVNELDYIRQKCLERRRRLQDINRVDNILEGVDDKTTFVVKTVRKFIVETDLHYFVSLMRSVNLTYKMSWYKNV